MSEGPEYKVPEYVVWYHSVGCLPDGEEPEFEGTYSECEEYVAEQEQEMKGMYGDHNLYVFSIDVNESDEQYEPEGDDAA